MTHTLVLQIYERMGETVKAAEIRNKIAKEDRSPRNAS